MSSVPPVAPPAFAVSVYVGPPRTSLTSKPLRHEAGTSGARSGTAGGKTKSALPPLSHTGSMGGCGDGGGGGRGVAPSVAVTAGPASPGTGGDGAGPPSPAPVGRQLASSTAA